MKRLVVVFSPINFMVSKRLHSTYIYIYIYGMYMCIQKIVKIVNLWLAGSSGDAVAVDSLFREY